MLRARSVLLLLILCAIVFWWRLGAIGLIDPDEPFYAQTAREMVETNDWITPRIFGQPQFEKPILFYWMAAGAFKIFGESEWAARAPSALFATLLVLLVYVWGAKFWSERAGFLSAVVLATGLEFAVMSRLMLTDIALAFFIAASLLTWWLALEEKNDSARRNIWLIAHFVCAGLAALTKGPVAWIVCVLATLSFLLVTRRKFPFRGTGLWIGAAVYALIAAPWYVVMLRKYGWEYFNAFFIHENVMRLIRAEHPTNNHFYYYIAILLFGSVPWMPALGLTLRRVVADLRTCQHDERAKFLWCWILTSFVFLTIVQSKLPSYIFFLFAPLALVVGKTLDDLLTTGFRTRGENWLVLGLGIFQFALTFAAPFINVAKPFATPALLVSACLAVALALQLFKQMQAWFAVHAVATVALLGCALTKSLPEVELMSSARPIALAAKQVNREGEPILTDKFLARGIYFYTHTPVRVLASKPQPFWTAHPLPVIVGKTNFQKTLTEQGIAICALREGDSIIWRKLGVFDAAEQTDHFGRNLLIRTSRAQLGNN